MQSFNRLKGFQSYPTLPQMPPNFFIRFTNIIGFEAQVQCNQTINKDLKLQAQRFKFDYFLIMKNF